MNMSAQDGFVNNRARSENRNTTVNKSKFSNSQFNESGNESGGINQSYENLNNKVHSKLLRSSENRNKYTSNSNINKNIVNLEGDDDIFDEYLNVRTDDTFMNKMYTNFQDNQRSNMMNNYKNERNNQYNNNEF